MIMYENQPLVKLRHSLILKNMSLKPAYDIPKKKFSRVTKELMIKSQLSYFEPLEEKDIELEQWINTDHIK